eukprot:TRINITY_DN758_c0_g1_i1.p1 TRINITY_DN758_c0_g1~~TRINITY_DN758_c0_g1_i1.p1  ORF type:complete len:67 (-),score=11.80 TRINITY_DN758_c0_g1_i1:271-471(-)
MFLIFTFFMFSIEKDASFKLKEKYYQKNHRNILETSRIIQEFRLDLLLRICNTFWKHFAGNVAFLA